MLLLLEVCLFGESALIKIVFILFHVKLVRGRWIILFMTATGQKEQTCSRLSLTRRDVKLATFDTATSVHGFPPFVITGEAN